MLGSLLGDGVFGPSGPHVFLAKVACSSCVGVCWYYLRATLAHRSRLGAHVERISYDNGPQYGGRDEGGDRRKTNGRAAMPLSTAVPSALAALYCAGLFSNSFIEAEDNLHRFLGASALLVLSPFLTLANTTPLSTATTAATTPPFRTKAVDEDKPAWTSVELLGKVLIPVRKLGLERPAYAALSAGCLRAAAAVQDCSPGVGLAPGAAFGFFRSLLPLPGLWYLCWLTRGGVSVFPVEYSTKTMSTGNRERILLPRVSSSKYVHGLLQGLSLTAIGAYWAEQAIAVAVAAAADTGTEHVQSGASNLVGPTASAAALEGLLFGLLPPARLFLPRVAYALCVVGLAVAALGPPGAPESNRSTRVTSGSPSRGQQGVTDAADAGAMAGEHTVGHSCEGLHRISVARAGEVSAAAAATVITHVVPVTVLLLGPGSPSVVLFVAAACACVLKALSLTARTGSAVPLGAVAVAWSVVGRAAFFLTGHHNQFSRLQYSAAFVGECTMCLLMQLLFGFALC